MLCIEPNVEISWRIKALATPVSTALQVLNIDPFQSISPGFEVLYCIASCVIISILHGDTSARMKRASTRGARRGGSMRRFADIRTSAHPSCHDQGKDTRPILSMIGLRMNHSKHCTYRTYCTPLLATKSWRHQRIEVSPNTWHHHHCSLRRPKSKLLFRKGSIDPSTL